MDYSDHVYGGLAIKHKGVYIDGVLTVVTLNYDLCVHNINYL